MKPAIPSYLLTGILGAGKTTLLNRLLKDPSQKKFGVVVNEFGSIDVDGELIETGDGPQLSLPNGCICCTIRDDLEESLVRLLENNPDLEGLLIEASGVADPTPIANTFILSEKLRELTRLDSVIAVVDVEAFPTLRGKSAYLARRQVAASDFTILNKCDLVSAEECQAVESSLEEWVPNLRIFRCSQAEIPLEIVLGSRFSPEQLPAGEPLEIHVHSTTEHCHHHHHDHQLVLESWSFEENGQFQSRKLATLLKSLPRKVFRAKGFVSIQGEDSQLFQVQLSGTRLDVRPAPAHQAETTVANRLVFLGEEGSIKPTELKRKLTEALEVAEELSPSDELALKVKRLLGEL